MRDLLTFCHDSASCFLTIVGKKAVTTWRHQILMAAYFPVVHANVCRPRLPHRQGSRRRATPGVAFGSVRAVRCRARELEYWAWVGPVGPPCEMPAPPSPAWHPGRAHPA